MSELIVGADWQSATDEEALAIGRIADGVMAAKGRIRHYRISLNGVRVESLPGGSIMLEVDKGDVTVLLSYWEDQDVGYDAPSVEPISAGNAIRLVKQALDASLEGIDHFGDARNPRAVCEGHKAFLRKRELIDAGQFGLRALQMNLDDGETPAWTAPTGEGASAMVMAKPTKWLIRE